MKRILKGALALSVLIAAPASAAQPWNIYFGLWQRCPVDQPGKGWDGYAWLPCFANSSKF